jgi:hypothetical protein
MSDQRNISYIEEIKNRRYTKEFHSFIKSCVSIPLESRYKKQNLYLKTSFFILRCSSDELQAHSFFKYQKKISHSQHLLNNDTIRLLQNYKTKESINPEIQNLEEIFGKYT